MAISLQQVRYNCAKARERMAQARAEHWAFGAFNLDDEPTLRAVAGAAKAKNAPVLVEATAGEVADWGLDNIRDVVDNIKREYGVEMYVNLDHSPSVEDAKKGIDAGFEFQAVVRATIINDDIGTNFQIVDKTVSIIHNSAGLSLTTSDITVGSTGKLQFSLDLGANVAVLSGNMRYFGL